VKRSLAFRAAPERAFESLYRHHASGVYRYALALLGSPADAEEVTQTTFLNAYRAIDGGERPRSPDAWLHSIALNLCRQRFRQAARRPSEVPLEEDVAQIVPDEESPTLSDLTRALKHLPFNQRAALVMREFDGLPPSRIAEALGVSASAVETLLFRARRNLREQLEGGLTCQQAERAISLQLDGLLPRGQRGHLRAHLRECADCARLARGMRGQRSSLKALALLPLPSALAWAHQPGSAAVAGTSAAGGASGVGALVAKIAAGTLAVGAVAGAAHEGLTHAPWRSSHSGSHHARTQAPRVRSLHRATIGAAPSPSTRQRALHGAQANPDTRKARNHTRASAVATKAKPAPPGTVRGQRKPHKPPRRQTNPTSKVDSKSRPTSAAAPENLHRRGPTRKPTHTPPATSVRPTTKTPSIKPSQKSKKSLPIKSP
jgi:RNA polymerase sigma factor (sigma-70 family)